MPWSTTAESGKCPASKPWAVVRDADGTVEGCHETEAAANRQRAALYAQEETSKSMQHKSFDILETKADAETGTFEATVAVFGNVDHGGDRIMPGAFSKSLERWRQSGDPIPVIFNHDWADANAHIGIANPSDVVETDQGLVVKAHLDVADNPVAKQVHRLLKRRSIKEFSFGYSTPKDGEKRAKDGANELSEIDLFEVGPTLKGMNPATELHAVKSALGVAEPADEATLRKQTEQLERDRIAGELPEPSEAPEVEGEEMITLTEARTALASEVKEALLEEFKANIEARAERPSEEELRKASLTVERERVEEQLPETPEPEPAPDPVEELKAMVGTLSTRLDELAESVKKAEETDKETQSRSVDPLRRRSERAVLEIQSDGISERKPPKQLPEPAPPEPEKDSVLRRRFEEDMLELLTGA